jgi:hypothetical protein
MTRRGRRCDFARDEQTLFMSLRWRCAPASGRKEVFCLTAYPALIPQRADAPRERAGLRNVAPPAL